MKKNSASIALGIIVALWGLSFSMTKPLLQTLGILNFIAYRFLIGGTFLTVWLILRRRTGIHLNFQLIKDGILSGLLLLIAFCFHTLGLKYTSVANNAFIVGAGVVFIPIIKSVILKEKQKTVDWMQMILSAVGLAMITILGSSTGMNFGDGITILGTVIFASYTLFIEKKISKYDALTFTAIQLQTVGILSLIGAFVLETPTLALSTSQWLNIAIMGLILTAVAYVVSNTCQKHLPALTVTVINTLEPFFAALFGWVLLSESLGLNILYGGLLIFISMILPGLKTRMDRRRKRSTQTA